MKAVMLSIQPQWCDLIAFGEKTLEVRKTRPKLETPFKVYIYCTLSRPNIPEERLELHGADGKTYLMNGTVIGEFTCDEIKTFVWVPYDLPFCDDGEYYLDDDDLEQTCMSYQQFADYGAELNLYGWHISDLVIYDKPKALNDFTKPQDDCHRGADKDSCVGCWDCYIPRPPQSWCYVEEV